MSRRRSVWPLLWVSALVAVMLGPTLAPGFVLTYDMVWVPSLHLRSDFWGLGSGLPRAVPSDAVVALADLVVSGMVLQKLVLAGSLIGTGLGAGRLVSPFGAPAVWRRPASTCGTPTSSSVWCSVIGRCWWATPCCHGSFWRPGGGG